MSLLTIFWGFLSVVSLILFQNPHFSHSCMIYWSTCILYVCRVKTVVHGLENIPQGEGKVQIIASNHSSFFDVFVLNSVLPVKFGWVAKQELFSIPFLGWHMKMNGYVSINRNVKNDKNDKNENAIKSMKQAADTIRRGNRICIFPEGTRSSTGELQPFKKGLFHLCLATRVPVIPIYIENSNKILAARSYIIRSGRIDVYIGKEMDTSHYTNDQLDDIMKDLRQRILELVPKQ